MSESLKVLFVCVGNSCRSPMAETVLRHLAKQNNLSWEIDSAALYTWNVGYPPEPRCIQVLADHGMSSDHIGRRITPQDFQKFDYIFGMDQSNITELKELAPNGATAKIELLGCYSTNQKYHIIEDPYFDRGMESFQRAYVEISNSCAGLVEAKTKTISLN